MLKNDHLVQAFMTEPSLEVWRKGKVCPDLLPLAVSLSSLSDNALSSPRTRAPRLTWMRSARAASCRREKSWRSPLTCRRNSRASLPSPAYQLLSALTICLACSIARRILTQRIASWTSVTQIFERNARRLEALSADSSRFANALTSLAEAEESWKSPGRGVKVNGWGGEEESVIERDELGDGVRRGLGQVGKSWEQLAADAEGRVRRQPTLDVARAFD